MLHWTFMFCPCPGHCAVLPPSLHQGQHHQQHSGRHRQTGRHCGLWADGGWGWTFQRSEGFGAIWEKWSPCCDWAWNIDGMQNFHGEMWHLISWKICNKFVGSRGNVALKERCLHRVYRVIYILYIGFMGSQAQNYWVRHKLNSYCQDQSPTAYMVTFLCKRQLLPFILHTLSSAAG